MKGLQKYLRKHGSHFTIKLAEDVNGRNFTFSIVDRYLSTMVWYNVSNSTIGDIIYLSGAAYSSMIKCPSRRECVKYALSVVGDVNGEDLAFASWLGALLIKDIEFDFREYV